MPFRDPRTNRLRIRCEVPFCRRTRGDRKGDIITETTEWVCGPHWTAVPKTMRRAYSRARRRNHNPAVLSRLWTRVKREAIERAVGVRA